MLIREIYSTQRTLRRKVQIEDLVNYINENGYTKEPIILFKQDDGKVGVENGHHRLTAYYLAGKDELDGNEYILLIGEENRKPIKMKMTALWCQCNITRS